GIPASGPIVRNLTLWVGFLGAAVAAREGRMLALATGQLIPEGRLREAASVFAATVAAIVSAMLAWASAEMVLVDRGAGMEIGAGIKEWWAEAMLPIAFTLIAVRVALLASKRWPGRVVALLGVAAGFWLGWKEEALLFGGPAWIAIAIIVAAVVLGAPLFVGLGGAALALFLGESVPSMAIPAETYRLAVNPSLAAIPLFTLAGFALAEGKQASQRLLRLFRAFFGWIPGGTAAVTAVLCAFFTVLTGGSGVTILAVGGLLLPALVADGYRDKFALGLVTAAGSNGLLWPPALPLILYSIAAEIPYQDLFIAGAVPGLIMLGMLVTWGVREGRLAKVMRVPFDGKEAAAALWEAKWEVLIPVIVLGVIFSGIATIVESAALVALYTLVTQCFIHRDLSIRRDLIRVLQLTALTVGGVLVILGVAVGLTNYLVDAQVAARVTQWAQETIHSKFVFLLALNGLLILVGALMDIFSAIFVVVPLILPIGLAFGIDPVHLGIIFIANAELGYLLPPVGENLFYSSFRFGRPLWEVARASVPFIIMMTIGVLLITYVPALTLAPLRWMGR
ncbi:MAG TPA: TRAP transporter large permease subunit, partial [Thermoanaerobaculia bacterium]|nr:TRAP transporter large permease subunit [Thermoanaerobaculia bacterium]